MGVNKIKLLTPPGMVPLSEWAKAVGLKWHLAYAWANLGRIPYVRRGRFLFVPETFKAEDIK